MDAYSTLTYEKTGRIARITLNRPKWGNAITAEMPGELMAAVEQANIDREVHVIALSGNGTGFCGGYDLSLFAENILKNDTEGDANSVLDPNLQRDNHNPKNNWDPMVDYAWMSRCVKGYMSLFHSDKPVICKVHGFCVAGGTDMALCSDLLLIEDNAKIGYPPARVWGSPTTSMWAHRLGPQRAKRLLFTGDCLSGTQAVEWGLAIESAPAESLDERFEVLIERIAKLPVNQLMMMKLLVNQETMQRGLHSTQILGTVFDGITRHTPEGYAFQQHAQDVGFRQAVRDRDEPFGDYGLSTFKG